MCLVLAIPKGNFIENKGASRAAQITHEEREDAALGALLPHWRTLLLDYWFTAQNGWNISSVKLINPSPASFMKMDLLSVIILMDCYDRTLTALYAGCLSKGTERGRGDRGGGEVWGHADRSREAKKKRRICRNEYTEVKKLERQTVKLLTFRWHLGASVAFRKTYEQVALITWDGTSRPRLLTYWKWLPYTKRAVCTTKPSSLSLVSIWRFLTWSSVSSLIYSNENCNLNLCLPLPPLPPLSRGSVYIHQGVLQWSAAGPTIVLINCVCVGVQRG